MQNQILIRNKQINDIHKKIRSEFKEHVLKGNPAGEKSCMSFKYQIIFKYFLEEIT